ncbi:MAG TPA: NfeD family protein [Candidatus Hydrogenedens sp.]|nr:NfeD family protein [Candidatus Hydrogenedens sp.]
MPNRMRDKVRSNFNILVKIRIFLVISILVLCLSFSATSDKEKESYIVICPAKEMVDDGMKVIIQRAISEANKGAKGFILEVDTPGGLVDAAIDISNTLLEAKCPTVAYIHGMGAISAGALISYSCKHIIMAPGSNIGASAPIALGEAQPSEEINEKTKSYLRSRYRTVAEVNGYDPLLAEAMVDAKIEVWGVRNPDGKYIFYRSLEEAEEALKQSHFDKKIEDKPKENLKDIVKLHNSFTPLHPYIYNCSLIQTNNFDPTVADNNSKEPDFSSKPIPPNIKQICHEGELLTLTSNEALELGLSEMTAENIEQVIKHFNWENCKRIQIEPTWAERLFKFLVNPMVSGILLLLGIGGLYIEMKTPGFGLPGTVGLVCLTLFFGSHLIIGLANWIDLLLLIIGLIFLGIEIFIIPGFGLTGVAGLICIILGIYFALTRVAIPEYPWDFERLESAGKSLTFTFTAFLVFVWATWKYLPKTPFLQRVVLSHTENAETGYTVQETKEQQNWIGSVGVAETVLRPAGKGRFKGQSLDVVSLGEYIEAGDKIRIIEVQGNRYVVEPEKNNKETNS